MAKLSNLRTGGEAGDGCNLGNWAPWSIVCVSWADRLRRAHQVIGPAQAWPDLSPRDATIGPPRADWLRLDLIGRGQAEVGTAPSHGAAESESS
jgi:hypothetical protein